MSKKIDGDVTIELDSIGNLVHMLKIRKIFKGEEIFICLDTEQTKTLAKYLNYHLGENA